MTTLLFVLVALVVVLLVYSVVWYRSACRWSRQARFSAGEVIRLQRAYERFEEFVGVAGMDELGSQFAMTSPTAVESDRRHDVRKCVICNPPPDGFQSYLATGLPGEIHWQGKLACPWGVCTACGPTGEFDSPLLCTAHYEEFSHGNTNAATLADRPEPT